VNRCLRFVLAVVAVLTAVLATTGPASAAPTAHVAAAAQPVRPHPQKVPWPITITIQTVPALADVHFTFDGSELITDGAGRTSYTDDHNFNKHTIALVDTAIDLPDRHYRFARWAGQRDPSQAFRPSVGGLPMRANYTVTAAFTVQYPVTARFVDDKGRPVDTGPISAVKIKSDAGQVLDFPKNGTIWLDGTLPAYRKSELVENDIVYSLQSVVLGGTNIVDAGRQKFSPAKSPTVTFTGQFYDLTVRAHDAMFSSNTGSQAKVTYPDGRVRSVPLGSSGTATLQGLPRGQYKVTITGGGGVVLAEVFVLSRDKELDVAVVTLLDVAAIGLVLLLVAAGLLLVGRVRLRRYLRRLPGRIRTGSGASLRRLRERTGRTPLVRNAGVHARDDDTGVGTVRLDPVEEVVPESVVAGSGALQRTPSP
jgi:hypothetical protein